MNLLPKEFLPLILTFAPLFSKPVWESAIVLLVGAILAPGKRTVSAILRVMGLQHEHHFQNYQMLRNASANGCSVVLYGPFVMPVGFYPATCQCLYTRWGASDGHR